MFVAQFVFSRPAGSTGAGLCVFVQYFHKSAEEKQVDYHEGEAELQDIDLLQEKNLLCDQVILCLFRLRMALLKRGSERGKGKDF